MAKLFPGYKVCSVAFFRREEKRIERLKRAIEHGRRTLRTLSPFEQRAERDRTLRVIYRDTGRLSDIAARLARCVRR